MFETEKGLDGKRKQVASGNARNTFKLPAGTYYVEARSGLPRGGSEVALAAGKLSEVTININAGSLNIQSQGKVHVTVFEAEKDLEGKRTRINAFHTGRPVLLPAGKYFLLGKLKGKQAEAEVEIKAGKMTEINPGPLRSRLPSESAPAHSLCGSVCSRPGYSRGVPGSPGGRPAACGTAPPDRCGARCDRACSRR